MSDQNECNYCKNGDDPESFGLVSIPFGDSSVDVELWVSSGIPQAEVYLPGDYLLPKKSFKQIITMNYCPVCGRKL